MSAHPRGRLSFLAAAAAIFAGCIAVQYVAGERLLAAPLREAGVDGRRRAIKRWVTFAVAWQALVVVAVIAYALAVTRGGRPQGLAWIAPPVAAVVGTALPLQLAAARLFRAAARL